MVPKVNLLNASFFEILKKNHRFLGFFGKVYYKNGKVVVFAQGLLIVCKLASCSHSCNLVDYKSWLFAKILPIFKIRSSSPRAQNLGLNFYICHFCLKYKKLSFLFFLEIDFRYQGLFSSGKNSSLIFFPIFKQLTDDFIMNRGMLLNFYGSESSHFSSGILGESRYFLPGEW